MDWSALAGAGLSLLSNIYGTMYGADRADEDRALTVDLFNRSRDFQNEDKAWTEDMSKRLMKYQYDKYSSPSAQVAAFRSAGLNPFIMSGSGSVGSGQGVGVPSISVPQRGVSPDIMRPNPVTGQFGNTGELISQSSALFNDRMMAKSKVASAIPDLVKGLGVDGAKRFISSIFGRDVDMNRVQTLVNNSVSQSIFETKVKEIESIIASQYGVKDASNKIALQEQSFNKMAAEIGLMASENRLNDQKIESLMSEYIRNLCDAWKLQKEGDYFVANAQTINAIRQLSVSALQNEVTKTGFENRINGYFEGSGLDDYLNSSIHSENTKKMLHTTEYFESSSLIKFLDRALGKYLKLSASN